MNQVTQWTSIIGEYSYAFTHERIKGNKHMLTVNGNAIEIKAGFLSQLLGFDEEFMLYNMVARLVIEKGIPDVIVNGVHLQSGEPYKKRPVWMLVFAVICLLIPIVSLGGALPVLIGMGGAALCASISKSSLSTAVKVILCIVATSAAWLLWYLLMVVVSML